MFVKTIGTRLRVNDSLLTTLFSSIYLLFPKHAGGHDVVPERGSAPKAWFDKPTAGDLRITVMANAKMILYMLFNQLTAVFES